MREKILSILTVNQGKFISEEKLAGSLSVSCNALKKEISAMQEEGLPVEVSSDCSYGLSLNADVLSAREIKRRLGPISDKIRIKAYSEIGSTNTEVRNAASNGEKEGLAVIAGMQTNGYGRRGRNFYSPSSSGLYMSILLRPRMSAESSLLITTAAAVSVAEAVENLSGKKAGIKWVNDIIVDGKKVSGILTEAALSPDSGRLDYAVLGIGVNLREPESGFPDEIKNIAGAVFDRPFPNGRNILASEIIKRFFDYYKSLSGERFYDDYKRRLTVLGKRINVIKPGTVKEAVAVGLDRNFGLIVRYDDGTEETLSSGEVSTKLK